MHSFAGQTIVITGASAGIGRELALTLAADRPNLALAARNAERLAEVAAECEKRGARAIAIPTDVTDLEQCRRLMDQTASELGGIDVLVNNAGRAMWSRFDQLKSMEPVEDVMRLNYLGSVYCTYHALPHLKRSRGRVVAMASVAGLTGVPLLSGYSASKHAVIGFFESLRIELAPTGVSVTIIAPDWVQSEILERALDAQGRPLEHSPLDQKTLMRADRCAQRIKRGIARRERLVLMSVRSKNLRWGKILMPWLVDWMTSTAVKRG